MIRVLETIPGPRDQICALGSRQQASATLPPNVGARIWKLGVTAERVRQLGLNESEVAELDWQAMQWARQISSV
jgi:hypothetical protein